jgi:hypothetical protein
MTLKSLELKTQHSKSGTLLSPWRAAWDHALAAYYRGQVAPRRFPRLEAAAAFLVWGVFLGGTALGVAVYPQATDVTCDWFACYYPLAGIDHPLETLLGSLANLLMIGYCLLPPALLLSAVVLFFRRRRSYRLPLTLASGWSNGATALLAITPLGPEGLVRVRFLTRLYGFWRRRALIAVILGAVATVIVSWHVLWPIFWWLGPWGQWSGQLILTALWCLAAVAWMVNLAAHSTLEEVTFTNRPAFFQFDWHALPTLTTIGSLITPPLLGRLYFSTHVFLGYHDANALSVIIAPPIMLVTGAVFAAINYVLAGWILKARIAELTTGKTS